VVLPRRIDFLWRCVRHVPPPVWFPEKAGGAKVRVAFTATISILSVLSVIALLYVLRFIRPLELSDKLDVLSNLAYPFIIANQVILLCCQVL